MLFVSHLQFSILKAFPLKKVFGFSPFCLCVNVLNCGYCEKHSLKGIQSHLYRLMQSRTLQYGIHLSTKMFLKSPCLFLHKHFNNLYIYWHCMFISLYSAENTVSTGSHYNNWAGKGP